jgi:hypothetical protein
MSIQAARKLIEHLDSKITEDDLGKPYLKGDGVKMFPSDKSGFTSINVADRNCKIAYIDGGNQELIGAPDFSIQLNRLYFGIWNGNQRVMGKQVPNRIEFFSSTNSRFADDQVIYDTSVFPVTEDLRTFLPKETDLSFDSLDRTVTVGTQRADISRVASIARVFAEWQLALAIVQDELTNGDILVLDRTLQTTFKNESKYLYQLVREAKKRGVIVSGLSKTCALFTDKGLSLMGALSKLAEDSDMQGEWYFPVAEFNTLDHNAIFIVVKLNPESNSIFRYEIQREQYNNLSIREIQGIMYQLAKNSSDVTFPGYPYGLIDADRFARVSFQEVEYYKTLVLSQLLSKGSWEKISRHVRGKDAHDVLNTLIG